MVGSEGDNGCGAAALTRQIQSAYDEAADSWAAGPARIYSLLARALVAAAPVPLDGRRILDLGAGTGTAGIQALAAGARQVVAADLSVGMLRHCGRPLHPVAADAAALPFADDSFDLVLAPFSLGHLPVIGAGLAEVRRVGRALAASAFAPGWTHSARAAVDEALAPFGYRPPAWYKSGINPSDPPPDDPERLGQAAAMAGFTDIRSQTVTVPTGLSSPAELATWRLGLAHLAPFIATLDACTAAEARAAAQRALAGAEPLVISMTVLTAR